MSVELFIRGKWKITLTDDGMLFHRRVQEIIELVDKTESEFEGKYEQLNIFATHNLIGNTARMIEEGLGYAITVEGAVDIYQNDNLCFRPFYPEFLTGTVMVWKKF